MTKTFGIQVTRTKKSRLGYTQWWLCDRNLHRIELSSRNDTIAVMAKYKEQLTSKNIRCAVERIIQ